MKPRKLTTSDGRTLIYRIVNDHNNKPWLVFLGGLGGTHLIWARLVKALREHYRILLWDYPGLTEGERLADTLPLSIQDLARYQLEILDSLNINTACLVGWSLGPQVSLEIARNNQQRINSIVALCGVAGEPFRDFHKSEPIAAALGLRSSIPSAVNWISDRIDKIERLRTLLGKMDNPTRWAKRFGFIDPIVDDLVFDAVIRDFVALDPMTYDRYVHAAAKHDASTILQSLSIPTLVIAGEKDRLIPSAWARKMSAAIKNAEFFEVRGGTHFLPLEYPELLALKIKDFLQRNFLK